MYIDDIKLFAKKWKRIGNSNTRSENMQSGCRDRIWHSKMHYVNNEKWEMTHDRWNRSTKSRTNRMLREKETYKYLGILEADTIKQGKMKEEIKKEYLRRTRKLL